MPPTVTRGRCETWRTPRSPGNPSRSRSGSRSRKPGPDPLRPGLAAAVFLGGAAQGLGERSAARGLLLRLALSGRRHRLRRDVARLALRRRLTLAGLVVQSQRQRNALASDLDLQHLDLDDVAGLHHLARILDEGFR